jgi:hypothetical protein
MNIITYFILPFLTFFTITKPMAGENHPVVFTCKTPKHLIIIDMKSPNNYRYRAWNLPKNTSSTADVEVTNGKMTYEGTGVCGSKFYSFQNRNVEYHLDDNAACSEEIPPKDAIGDLYVLIAGQEKNHYYCFR